MIKLLIAGMMLVPMGALADFEPTTGMKSCKRDAECVEVPNDCAGCCKSTAVNKLKVRAFESQLQLTCRNYKGGVCECCGPDYKARCVKGACKLEEVPGSRAKKCGGAPGTAAAGPVTLESLDAQLTARGFQTNMKRRKKDGFYIANKGASPTKFGAWVEVHAFEKKDSAGLKQLRFNGVNCVVSKLPNSTAFEILETELKASFKELFGTEAPKELLATIQKDKGEELLQLPGFRKTRVFRGEPYCDATRGGWSVVVDLFL